MSQYFSHKPLTEKQWYWVEKLIGEAKKRLAQVTIEPQAIIPNGENIQALLDMARKKQPYPVIRLMVAGYKVDLRPKQHRGANVRFDGQKIGMLLGEKLFIDVPLTSALFELVEKLKQLAENPEEMAKKFAIETGACCFCGITIVNKHSLAVGYGPICAANYGLPWGEEGDPEIEALKRSLQE
jgi:hypothetical protein